MSYCSRVYKTTKLSNGQRVVSSMDTSDWAILQILKFFVKMPLYLILLPIIIPIKLLKRKK